MGFLARWFGPEARRAKAGRLLDGLGSADAARRRRARAALKGLGRDAVPALILAVEDRRAEAQWQSAKTVLDAQDAQTQRGIRTLMQSLASDDAGRRERASAALSQMPSGARELVVGLAGLEAAADAMNRRRIESISLLGELAGDAETSTMIDVALVRALQDECPVGKEAEQALERRDPGVCVLVSQLLAQTNPADQQPLRGSPQADGSPETRLRCLRLLAKLAQPDTGLVAPLVKVLADKDERARELAIATLERLGPVAAAAIPALLNATRDGKTSSKALGALARIAGDDPAPLVAGLTTHAEQWVRTACARALGEMKTAARTALPTLYQALARSHDPCRGDFLQAIRSIGADADGIPSLVDAIKTGLVGAGDVMATLGAAAVPALMDVSRDPNARRVAIEALGRIGPDAAASIPVLRSALADPADGVQRAAVVAIGKLGESAASLVPELVAQWDEISCRSELRHALATLGDPLAIDPVMRMLFETARAGVPSEIESDLMAMVPRSALTREIVEWAVRASTFEHKYRGYRYDAGYITLEMSDNAIRRLCAVDSAVTSNILHLVSGKPDARVTMSTGCTPDWTERVSFADQIQTAKKELARRGNPPYRPEVYTVRTEATARQAEAERDRERQARYQTLKAAIRNPNRDHGDDKWTAYEALASEYPTAEVFGLLARDVAGSQYIPLGEMDRFHRLLVKVGASVPLATARSELGVVEGGWPRLYGDVLRELEARKKR